MLFGSRQRLALLLAVAAVVVALDAVAKRIVQQNLALGEKHDVLPDLLVLTHIQNTGAAYGLLTGQRWLLVVSAAVIAAATPLLMRALPGSGRWAWTGPVLTGMIIGGAAGNLVERARLGYVTDFIQTPPIELFQVFNVADASISVAITALLVLTFLVHEPAAVAPPAHPVETVTAAGEAESEDESPDGIALAPVPITPPDVGEPVAGGIAEGPPVDSPLSPVDTVEDNSSSTLPESPQPHLVRGETAGAVDASGTKPVGDASSAKVTQPAPAEPVAEGQPSGKGRNPERGGPRGSDG